MRQNKDLNMTVDTDDHLIWMIGECFRNNLRLLIRIEPVLDHITFIPRDQKERIMTKARNEGNSDAVNALIDTIVKGPRPPGWSREFIDALSSAGCTYAALIVDTDTLPTPSLQAENDYCVQLIMILSPSLLKMKTTDVCEGCYAKNLVSEDDKQNILAATSCHGSKAGARILLDRIVMKPPGWFSIFLEVLRQTEHPDLVEELTGAKNALGLGTDASPEKDSSSSSSSDESVGDKEKEDKKTPKEEEQPEEKEKDEEEKEEEEKPKDKAKKEEELKRRSQALALETSVDTSGSACCGEATGPEAAGADAGEEDLLTLRPQQLAVAQPALEGRNIIVSMPTGSGKTRIAVYVAKQHLDHHRQQGTPGKVMVIVNKAFANTVAEHDVIICTAQILLNALQDTEDGISLADITLLVIDECHHTKKGGVYQKIMDLYLSDKLGNIKNKKAGQPEAPLPQILGLTASLGVDKACKIEKAKEHILRICASLDASALMTAHMEDQARNKEMIIARRRAQDPFGDVICSLMRRIQEHAQLKPTVAMGTQCYEQWVVDEEKKAACDDDQRKRVCAEHLRQYNEALIQSHSIRMCDAYQLLISFYRQEDRKKEGVAQTHTEEFLFKLFNENVKKLEDFSKQSEYENNVLSELRKTILKKFSGQDEVRGIIFTETRLSAMALHSWIQENSEFHGVKVCSSYLIGAGDQSAVKPMTASEQRDVLRKFNSGDVNLLIATTVAEEGLDIERCNVVIRYCLVTSEIAMIQARGRGRAEGSSYVVIGVEGSGVAERERLNEQREKLMKKAIEAIQKMTKKDYDNKVMQFQMEGWLEKGVLRRRTEERSRRRRMEPSAVKFRCRGCTVVACGGEDIEVIENAHHVNLSEAFRAKFKENTNSSRRGLNAPCEAEKYISCQGCGQFWGPMMLHRQLECPCLSIQGFVVLQGDEEETLESWTKLSVNFNQFDFYSHASRIVYRDEENT
ncbi:interferon-induced helicase C domain-containing protein 1-like isoform X2 [Engraulis encrasicolus]|uniref:interferon-induced helicase C domain-containing protein 1-like isoform X2 n=1 Tax=Engraulis encrasicolus TaxID=184585 RepID=UPI002FD55E4C